MPQCSESALLGICDSYAEHYHNVRDLVEHNAHYFNQHSEDMDLARNLVPDNSPPEMVWDTIAPTIEENGSTVSEDFITIRHVDSDEDDGINDISIPCNVRDDDV